MKSKVKTRIASTFGVIAIIAVIGFSMSVLSLTGCDNPTDGGGSSGINGSGGGGGTAVNIANIPGVTAPVAGEMPVTTITETEQYTGTVEWRPATGSGPNPPPVLTGKFAGTTQYMAFIRLTAKEGFTFTGVAENFFKVAGATSVYNPPNTGAVTAFFPETLVASVGISLSVTGTHTFAAATSMGYEQPEALEITVTNTSDQATGELTITMTGQSWNYTVSSNTISSIAVGGTGSFTVQPNAWLANGTYTATVTVQGDNGFKAAFNVSFKVGSDISLGWSGTVTFDPVNTADYTPQTITQNVMSNLSQATGPLAVVLSGTNADSFTLSTSSINSIPASGNATFDISNKAWLAVGTYTATVTITGSGDISASFDVLFRVYDPSTPTNGFSITQDGAPLSDTYTFPSAEIGYTDQTPLEFTITNTGLKSLYSMEIIRSSSVFTLSSFKTSLSAGETQKFTVVPITGIRTAGTYTATITVRAKYFSDEGDYELRELTPQAFNVSFTVTAPEGGYAFTLSQGDKTLSSTDTITFPSAASGYASQTPITVTITNTGSLPLYINPDNFTFLDTSANANAFMRTSTIDRWSNLQPNGTATITVEPITGLAIGTYTATVKVATSESYGNLSQTFNVSFSVSANNSVTLTPGTEKDFGSITFGSGIPAEHSVTINNSGNATGAISIAMTGANAGNFTLSKTSISNIAAGASDTFTVRPNSGLSAGTYNATVRVYGANIQEKTFNVSFKVNSAVIDLKAIPGIPAPVRNAAPATTIIATQYTGAIAWSSTGNSATPSVFAASTVYTATITLTARDNYTFSGVTANFFTVAGASTVSHSAGTTAATLVVTAVYPATAAPPATGIGLSQSGDYAFKALDSGYTTSNVTPLQVSVNNYNATTATGALTAALSGTNSSSFTLSTTSIASINGGATTSNAFNVRPNTGLAAGNYTATITVTGSGELSAAFDVIFIVMNANDPYIITGSNGLFTARKTGGLIGTADQPIQTVINDIRTHANGNARTIQFGNITDVLDIGESSVSFNNTGGTWGAITLTGKLYSEVSGAATGLITTADNVNVSSGADIENGAGDIDDITVYHNSTGTFTVTGGTIGAFDYGYNAIRNNGTGTVRINNGTVQAYGRAINNASTGTITVAGGTVQARYTYAIQLGNGGSLTVSGGTVKTTNGGIAINKTAVGSTLTVSGGTVSAEGGTAINVNGDVTISGGTIKATGANGRAIYIINNAGYTVNISGEAQITSENQQGTQGTIYLDGTARISIIGNATVSNTFTGGGNAIYSASSYKFTSEYAVLISGSSKVTANGFAVWLTVAGTQLRLASNPTINGRIRPSGFSTSTTVLPLYLNLSSGSNIYRLDYGTLDAGAAGGIVSRNVGDFSSRIWLVDPAWELVKNGDDLVIADANDPYILTGSSTTGITLTRRGSTIGTYTNGTNADDTAIYRARNVIKDQAANKNVTIQFERGGNNTLSIYDTFNLDFTQNWGTVTLTGKISSDSSRGVNSSAPTILLGSNMNVTSNADISNTAGNHSIRLSNNNTTLRIIGGTISTTGLGTAISATGTGNVITINGASTVRSNNGTAIDLTGLDNTGSNNTLSVIMGTISNTSATNPAIKMAPATDGATTTGSITISGGTISTENTRATVGTITIGNFGGSNTLLTITGGMVRNTSTVSTNYAIYNNSTPTSRISISTTGAVITGSKYGCP